MPNAIVRANAAPMPSNVIRFPRRKLTRRWLPAESDHDFIVRSLQMAVLLMEQREYARVLRTVEGAANTLRKTAQAYAALGDE